MAQIMSLHFSIVVAYALGCVSFATVVARLHGVDIRKHGSGNPGATNVGRVIGKPWGLLVLALDVAKGWLPVQLLVHGAALSLPPLLVDSDGATLVLLAAVLGHVCPVTARFSGGKGVATLIGGCLALDPKLALIAIVAHLVAKFCLGFVSLASLVLVWCIPITQVLISVWLGTEAQRSSWVTGGAGVMALLALLVTWRHRDNLSRLRAGTEDRYDDPQPPEQVRNA
ncbi:MAG: glycerol-3-phosphate acyltransferase PlsY [Pseudohongiellaceae bacterium]|jgi:glycerol-3-phosphate acyltransferase PlsY